MSEAASPPIATAATSRRSRRRRRSQSSWNKVWIALGIVVLVVMGVFFGARIWLKSYLQSDKFRLWMSNEMSKRLNADVNLDSIRWQDSSATVSALTAVGSPESPFAKIEARDLRATINAGAVWDRVWQVDGVNIARVFLDFSNTASRPPAPAPAGTGSGSGGGVGFLSSFLPNRTVVNSIDVDQAGFAWKGTEHSAGARNISLHIKPAERNEFFLLSGQGGTMELDVLPNAPVKLRNFEAALQGEEIILEELTAEAGGADITAEGTVATGDRPSLNLKGSVAGLDLARIIPEDWIKRLRGKVGGNVKVSGDPRNFDRLSWSGTAILRDGVLEGLPLLQVIARKTRNESFIRFLLKDARTEFTRTSEGAWLLEKLIVDAPGLMRLKGDVRAGADRSLRGDLLLGIVPGTLRYLAGAEQSVFLPLSQLGVTQRERSLFSSEDSGLLWTRLQLHGTLDHPQEDLADRLAKAWFNATVDEVLNMSVDGAFKAAETASKAAADAAGTILEKAPDVLETGVKTGTDLIEKGVQGGGDLLEKGVEGGLKTIEGLIPVK
jgi:hypothetical protein